MGKNKTQRTEALHQAARRYTVGKQVEQAIEQHNFNRLVKAGVIVRELPLEVEFGMAHKALSQTKDALNKALNPVFEALRPKSMLKKDEGGGQGRCGRGRLIVPTNP